MTDDKPDFAEALEEMIVEQLELTVVDESFDHLFGVCHCWSLEPVPEFMQLEIEDFNIPLCHSQQFKMTKILEPPKGAPIHAEATIEATLRAKYLQRLYFFDIVILDIRTP